MNNTVVPTTPSSNAAIPSGANGGIAYGGPSSVTSVNTPNTVNIADLNNHTGLYNVPAPQINASSFSSFVNSLNAGMPQLQQQENQVQNVLDQSLSAMMQSTQDIGNKGNDYLTMLNTPEFKDQQQKLADANLRFAQTQAKFNNDYFANEGKGYDTSLVQGLQALNRTRATVELGNQATIIQAMQGNIDAAKKTAEETINAKYMVKEADLKAKQLFYEANKDKLSGIQKKLADQRSEVINASLAKLQAEKDMQKFNATLAADLFEKDKIGKDEFANVLSGKQSVWGALASKDISTNYGAYANVKAGDKQLVGYLKQYRDLLNGKSAIQFAVSPNLQAEKQNLVSLITAEYKQAKKLGTLDAGVQKLIDGILGNNSIMTRSNVGAQLKAVDNTLASFGYDVQQVAENDQAAQVLDSILNNTQSDKYKPILDKLFNSTQ